MAISPKQFVATTEFHQKNLNTLLEQYIDLPEAPGILAAMLYLQRTIQQAKAVNAETEKDKK